MVIRKHIFDGVGCHQICDPFVNISSIHQHFICKKKMKYSAVFAILTLLAFVSAKPITPSPEPFNWFRDLIIPLANPAYVAQQCIIQFFTELLGY